MKDFNEIEKEYGNFQVYSSNSENRISGTLELGKKDPRLRVLTEKYISSKEDKNGWFDIELTSEHGHRILFHNSIITMSQGSGVDGYNFLETIFPNVIVFNSERISKDKMITRIQFSLDRIQYFFHSQVIEYQAIYEDNIDFLKDLRKLRKLNSKKYEFSRHENEYDFSYPDGIYVVHRLPRILKFRCGGRVYEIWPSLNAKGLAWMGTSLAAGATAHISFDHAASIDEAIDAVWEWRRFFSQVAFEELLPTAMAARHRSAKKWYYADVYLPNIQVDRDKSQRSFHLSEVPCNRWKDRTKLAKAMQEWLENQNERRVFRVFVDHVITDMSKRTSISDIVSLCSAVDSLPEITAPNIPSKIQLRVLSAAAIKSAVENKIEIDEKRIRNVLGSLRNKSIRQKWEYVISKSNVKLSDTERKALLDTCLQLRQMAAHGTATSQMNLPTTAPVVQALTAICIIYDLRSTGLIDGDAPLIAKSKLHFAIGSLMRLVKA